MRENKSGVYFFKIKKKKYISKQFRSHSWVPEWVVQESLAEGYEDTLVFVCMCRSVYRISIIYNFSYRKLAKLIGSSLNATYKHIRRAEEKGLLRREGNDIIFNSYDRLNKKYIKDKTPGSKRAIFIQSGKNIQESKIKFRLSIIDRNLKDQEYLAQTRDNIIKLRNKVDNGEYISNADYKKLNSYERENGVAKDSDNPVLRKLAGRTTLSNKKAGQLVNRSQSTGRRVKRKLMDMGLLKQKRVSVRESRHVTFSQFKFMRSMAETAPGTYWKDGYMCREISPEVSVVNKSFKTKLNGGEMTKEKKREVVGGDLKFKRFSKKGKISQKKEKIKLPVYKCTESERRGLVSLPAVLVEDVRCGLANGSKEFNAIMNASYNRSLIDGDLKKNT